MSFLACCCRENPTTKADVLPSGDVRKASGGGFKGDTASLLQPNVIHAPEGAAAPVPASQEKHHHETPQVTITSPQIVVALPPSPSQPPAGDETTTSLARAPTEALESSPTRLRSNLTPEQKEQEKQRLQQKVKEFARQAADGLPVHVMPEWKNGEKKEQLFMLDKNISNFNLASSKGAADAVSYSMGNVTAVLRGGEIARRDPSFPYELHMHSLGIDFADGSFLVLWFEGAGDRDDFYTCLKILKMSVDIGKRKQAEAEAKKKAGQ